MESMPRHEARSFLAAADAVPPSGSTACAGWNAHQLIAHVASGAEGLAEQVEAFLAGDAIPMIASWPAREVVFAALAPEVLRRRLESAEQRMSAAFTAMTQAGFNDPVEGVGFGFPIAELILHMRQEFAVHRWDLLGDDPRGDELLAQPELLAHSVRMLGHALVGPVADVHGGGHGNALIARLRCPGEPDLVVEVGNGIGALRLADNEAIVESTIVVDTDPAARQLLLWGRRIADSARLRTARPDDLAVLRRLLPGY